MAETIDLLGIPKKTCFVFMQQMALKLADMGHLSAPLPVHLRWVAALEEEFFRQGDAEKACHMPVSPLFDRNRPGVTKSQVCDCFENSPRTNISLVNT